MSNHLNKSFSTFFFAFRTSEEQLFQKRILENRNAIWQKSFIEVKEQFLLPHVHEFFSHNASLRPTQSEKFDTSQAVVFELKESLKKTRAQASIEKLFGILLKLKSKNEIFRFHFCDGMKKGLLSPKLIIVPKAKTGLLTFSLELDEELSTSKLIDFNYACRALYASHKTAPKVLPFDETPNEQITKCFEAICSHNHNENEPFFSLNELVSFFLADFGNDEILPISPKRFHLFSFAQSSSNIVGKDLNEFIFRFSRVYNDQYFPSFERVKDNPESHQSFRDVYWAVSPEGGCVFINSKTEEISFLKNYSNSIVKNRYLWIYFMAYLQRISLINTAYTVTDLLGTKKDSVKEISNTISALSKIQIRSMFSEVSHIKMHNDFYNLCRENFKISALFDELKNELFDLNMIVQQQFEMKRAEMEAKEIEREKIEADQRRIADEKQLKAESRLNFILSGLGILTFLSVWKDFADLLVDDGITKQELNSLLGLSIIVALIFLVVYLLMFRSKE